MPETSTPNLSPNLSQTHAEMLVLSVLAEGSSYGYAVSKAIEGGSGGAFSLGPARLYPLLARLEKQGLVTTSWEEVRSADAETGAAGRRRKWYTLSAKGERRLAQHVAAHRRYTALIEAFLPSVEGEPA